MNHSLKYFTFCLCLILLISCKGKKQEFKLDLSEVYLPHYTENFNIYGDENENLIEISVLNPWQGAKNVSSSLLIAKNGKVPEDYPGEILNGKAERIICMSSTHIAMLDILGAIDKIVGVSGKEYITNEKISLNDSIPDIGYEGNINYEKLLAVNPDLVLLFSVNGASSMESKLKEFKIPFIYIGDYVEDTPLGKLEWIVPIAEILDKRNMGIKILEEKTKKYNILKDSVSHNILTRPKIMVNSPFADSWFMPSTSSYVAQMIRDAGGEYIYKKITGNSSLPIDTEEALTLLSNADFWINIGNIKNFQEFKESLSKFINSRPVLNGNLFNNNRISSAGGGNDCYESGVVNPDLILRDLIKIFHPELIREDFTYYQKLE